MLHRALGAVQPGHQRRVDRQPHALAPYQPYFIAATLACLGYGYWLVYQPGKVECAEGAACARPLPNHIIKASLVLATVLVTGAIAFDLLAPLILKS